MALCSPHHRRTAFSVPSSSVMYIKILGFIGVSLVLTLWVLIGDLLMLAEQLRELAEQSPAGAMAVFAVISGVSQLLIVPSGSVLLMVGGYLLGALPAAMIYATLQIGTTVPVYRLGSSSHLDAVTQRFIDKDVRMHRTLSELQKAPFALSIVLRLTPVIPSAIACLLAVSSRIPLCTLLAATALVCWVRPLFFASVGATAPALSATMHPADLLNPALLWPLFSAFAAAVLLLLGRLWVKRRTT